MNGSGQIMLDQLTVGYGDRPLLRDINLSLEEGQLVCFMGPNGAGKSTLLRTMAGFQKPLYGGIRINERQLDDLNRKDLSRHLSVVLTDRLNAGQMTGKEIVAAGRYPYIGWLGRLSREDEQVIRLAMEETETLDLSDLQFYKMSDGQRQKIMIARALCQQTPIILLDEPTAHLDLNNRVSVVMLLRKLAHDHKRTILMTTHELDLSLQLADRIWLAELNVTVHEGFPEDLVLNGQLDRIFKFKGYDLKTGTIEKRSSGRKIHVTGSGFVYLWTANAFERMGYTLDSEAARKIATPQKESDAWYFREGRYSSLEALIRAVDESYL